MDFEKTKEYYEQLASSDLCQCAYCRNYVKEVKKSYPLVSKYLENIGVDIEKPLKDSHFIIEIFPIILKWVM